MVSVVDESSCKSSTAQIGVYWGFMWHADRVQSGCSAAFGGRRDIDVSTRGVGGIDSRGSDDSRGSSDSGGRGDNGARSGSNNGGRGAGWRGKSGGRGSGTGWRGAEFGGASWGAAEEGRGYD